MADYRVTIADRTYDVSIKDDQLLVNGDRISYDMDTINENGLHILRQPNKNTEAILDSHHRGKYAIQIEGSHLSAEVFSGFHQPSRKKGLDSGNVHSPMPGLIIDVLVSIGESVKKGQTLIIQEAMKMQMKLRAPSSGVIEHISISPGDQVDKGFLLISLACTG